MSAARTARALLVALVWLWAGAALALPESTWVLAVGNNHGDADEEPLLYAERDAREVVDVLRRLGGVSTRRATVLVDEDAATVRQTLVELNAAIRAHNARHPERKGALVVFYSGHADADALHLGGTRLDFDELRGLVEGSPANLRLLVVDACRSGGVSRVKGVKKAKAFNIDLKDNTAAEGVAIMTSSAAGESSQESDRLRGSFFSHHLINALRGAADRNEDGRVTLTEAYAYTYEQTLRSTGRTLEVQHPTYAYDVKGRGEVILSEPRRADRRSGVLKLADESTYFISEGHAGGPIVAEVSPPKAGATVALPAKTYFVQQRLPQEYREYQVALAAGQTLDLAEAPHKAVRYDRLVRRRGGTARSIHGLSLLGGGRGEVLEGSGATPHLVVGYSADLHWGSVGVRLRGTQWATAGADGDSPRTQRELGLGLTLQRFVDLEHFSVSFGLLMEGAYVGQRFEAADRQTVDRDSYAVGIGALFSAERHLGGGLALRLEGGPLTMVMQQAELQAGAPVGEVLGSPLTWWGALGVVWRL
ncbi:MAG: caspase family protein [Myxococcales bacterium]|nr:caspase family protein [Myxococcales bacterium]MCB9522900.1 caspase family protein [Myxococcales bacterium]